MKKRVWVIVLALFLCILSTVCGFGASSLPRVVDDAGLLSNDEKEDLQTMLNEISERQQVDVVVVTVPSLGGATSMDFADDFYDSNGYGFGAEYDGILLLISTEEREWYIGTTGFGITAITDAGMEYIAEKFLDDLSDGNYAAAFTTYAEQCDAFITQARTGEAYDVGNFPKKPVGFFEFLCSLAGGFVISLIITGIMSSKLKSVRSQAEADQYIKSGSMEVTQMSDLYLYTHVDRREKPKVEPSSRSGGGSSTHRSSSGRRHGGGGGRF